MTNVFVYGDVAIAAGAPANCRTPNVARISFFYLSVLGLFTSKKLLLTNMQSKLAASFLCGGQSETQFKNPVSNSVLNRSQTEHCFKTEFSRPD